MKTRGQSMRSIVKKKLHVSEKTIRRSVHEDIQYVINLFPEKSKENRLYKPKRLLNPNPTPTFGLLTLQISSHWTILCWALLRRRLINIPITPKTLKTAIVQVTSDMNKEQLIRTCTRFSTSNRSSYWC